MRRTTIVALLLCALGTAVAALPGAAHAAAAKQDQRLRLLAINDLHGNLEPPSGSSGEVETGPPAEPGGDPQTTEVGGLAFLARHLELLERRRRHTLFVGGGDLVGASPLISGLFHDEPTVEALNAMGMDVTAVGNHEFDEGVGELLRLQRGGCGPKYSCALHRFAGAAFRYLAANVLRVKTGKPVLPSYEIKRVGGIPVAFIGLPLEGTPDIVTPSGVKGLKFKAEASTVNRLVRQLSRKRGVEAFVVLIHQGGEQGEPYARGFKDVNRCDNPSGDVFGIADAMSAKVDLVVSAHTHEPYVCRRGGKVITSAASFGRLITTVDVRLDGRTGDMERISARNRLVTRDVRRDATVQGIIDRYAKRATPIANRVVGAITGPLTKTAAPSGESPLGDVIADSQLAATSAAGEGGARVAFMNPGGIRADVPFSGPAKRDGEVTYNDLYTVQPFANTLTVKTLTGAQIKALLEQQFDNPVAGQDRILQVSRGFAYRYDRTAPAGSRVDAASLTLDGAPIAPADPVRVTMNSFLATGGDGFTVFREGTDQLGGDVDIDAAVAYLQANRPLSPPPPERITRTG